MNHFTTPNNEYIIHVDGNNNIELRLRTIAMEKSIDLAIFFLSQLFNNIRFGANGVIVNGYVTKNWKKMKRFDNVFDRKSMIVQLVSHSRSGP